MRQPALYIKMAVEWRDFVCTLTDDPLANYERIIDTLRRFIYPIEGLLQEDGNILFNTLLTTPSLHAPTLVPKWSHLLHTIITTQRLAPPIDVASSLFELLLTLVHKSLEPSEILYALSSLIKHARIVTKMGEAMLLRGSSSSSSSIIEMVFVSKDVHIKRAALDCVISICQYIEVSPLILNGLMEPLLYLLNSSMIAINQDILQLKLQVSLLRLFHQMLSKMSSLQPLPTLPSLLAMLKVTMTSGLPGHQIPRALVPLTPHPGVVPVNSGYQATSVAGPKQNRTRRKPRPSSQSSHIPSDHTSSDHVQPLIEATKETKGFPQLSSGSESELSDSSDVASGNHKEVNLKLRLRSLTCLNVIFQSLERQPAFSYGLSFLPDCPRSPKAPPTLLTVLCKDPSHKCRNIAISVLIAILDNSKPFLAVANDQHVGSHPYTPYSSVLGGVVNELHRSIFLAISAETHPSSLTQIIKCLSVLISNVPYHQLSEQYISRIITTLQPIATKQDTDVAIGCLTCYGALISLSLPHCDVEAWLREGPTADWPWIVEHCIELIRNKSTNRSLQMEGVQVLTAIVKFFFPVIKSSWLRLSQVYFDYLADQPEPLQLHALKFMEEIGRTLTVQLDIVKDQEFLNEVVSFWERLILGPLVRWLQSSHTHPLPCSQSCSVVATIGDTIVKGLKNSTRVLMLTLVLGLSNDENSSIKSNAVRALGIFSQYPTLRDDSILLMDISDRLTKGLNIKEILTVRVQASWAVANLTDSLLRVSKEGEKGRGEDVLCLLYPSLAESVGGAMRDVEKVKVNAVRAAGNLLHILTDEIYTNTSSHVTVMCSLLTSSINTGIMKSRWNTCYACYNAVTNEVFVHQCSRQVWSLYREITSLWVQVVPMIDELCKAMTSCKNFKVRTNAALALGSHASYSTPNLLESVWAAVLVAIGNSESQHDFTEYKQTSALRIQLCQVFCILITQMKDVNLYLTHPPSADVIRILEQPIKEILASEKNGEKGTIIGEALSKLKQFNEEHNDSNLFVSSLVEAFQLRTGINEKIFV